jgi:quercetin dioxygenase-like cupin family protein
VQCSAQSRKLLGRLAVLVLGAILATADPPAPITAALVPGPPFGAGLAWAGPANLPLASAVLVARTGTTQEAPTLLLTPLAAGELERLPDEPLRFVVREFRWPVGFTSATLNHPPDVFYVVEGATSITRDGMTGSFGPGSAGFAMADHVHATVGNLPTRVLSFNLYPASLPTPPDSATATVLYESAPLGGLGDGPYTLALQLLEASPNQPVPPHIHPGPTLPYLVEGEMAHLLGGIGVTRRAGDSWLEPPGILSAGEFTGSAPVRILVAQVLGPGDPPLIPVD